MKKEASDHFYEYFPVGKIVSKNEIVQYLNRYYPTFKPSTLEWRFYDLRSEGYIANAKNGFFVVTDCREVTGFHMEIERDLLHYLMEYNLNMVNLKINNPKETEVNISVWNTNFLNQFTTHQVFRNFTIIEIDENRVENLFFELKLKYRNVIPSVKVKNLEYFMYNEPQVYVVEKLPKRSPLMNKKSRKNHFVSIPKPEKILVDLLVYKNTILFYDESEIMNVYRAMFKLYQIDRSTLLNYARVRGKKIRNEVETLIMDLGKHFDD